MLKILSTQQLIPDFYLYMCEFLAEFNPGIKSKN